MLCAQQKVLEGLVSANGDVEGIHIINKTASKFSKTDENGSFVIPASLQDTLQITGVKYKTKEIIITTEIFNSKTIKVALEDQINELDEVIVGKVLTGNLMLDVENSEAKRDINFYDVGIPGYTGRRKTQSERRLYEATTGGGIVPLNPIMNWISGRTKRLKYLIKLERQDQYMDQTMSEFSEMLMEIDELEESQKMEFFYFASEDERFMELYNLNNDMLMFEFLNEKLEVYRKRLTENKN
ncbi:carboxypeptidase-like regulatory domain-containing protein [Mangrovimonas sp. TPBH4]|uniref:carboxypeptidase-like regulatory domain-containing protein n=1 Tax=Mangrovimonas sp. TPBH4 TaxID=1645914 RepID=UPI0006B4D8E2|nr:carboxypeptidase-like regulatory domain-containing protein [Mangrovimonas sp. TPBH4]